MLAHAVAPILGNERPRHQRVPGEERIDLPLGTQVCAEQQREGVDALEALLGAPQQVSQMQAGALLHRDAPHPSQQLLALVHQHQQVPLVLHVGARIQPPRAQAIGKALCLARHGAEHRRAVGIGSAQPLELAFGVDATDAIAEHQQRLEHLLAHAPHTLLAQVAARQCRP